MREALELADHLRVRTQPQHALDGGDLHVMHLAQQSLQHLAVHRHRTPLKMLHNDLLGVGFALSDAVRDDLVAEPVWTDPLSVIKMATERCSRHPLHSRISAQLPLRHTGAGALALT